jgi:hypothetical protein
VSCYGFRIGHIVSAVVKYLVDEPKSYGKFEETDELIAEVEEGIWSAEHEGTISLEEFCANIERQISKFR